MESGKWKMTGGKTSFTFRFPFSVYSLMLSKFVNFQPDFVNSKV